MVGGLVMGALEKLYRRPSLLAYALLAARVHSLAWAKGLHQKSTVPHLRARR
jgi:hypothetical protein